jgi:hypothetical protein
VTDTANADALRKDIAILDVKLDERSLAVAKMLLEGSGDPALDEETSRRAAALRDSSLLRPLFVP